MKKSLAFTIISDDTAGKMRTLVFSLMALAAFSVARADDFTTTEGKVYKGAKVALVEPDGIVVQTQAGFEKISFYILPMETQEKYHFDQEKLDEYRAAEILKRSAWIDKEHDKIMDKECEKEVLHVKATVTKIVEGGAFVSVKQQSGVNSNYVAKPLGDVFIMGDFSKFAVNAIWEGLIWPTYLDDDVHTWSADRDQACKLFEKPHTP